MADPIQLLTNRLQDALTSAFGEEHRDTDPVIRHSDRADFQANIAMSLGKQLGKPPREIADAINSKLDKGNEISETEVAGPGFINISLTENYLGTALSENAADVRLGVPTVSKPERIVVEYSHPNVAKEMHVGHLRSTIIGDVFARVFDHLGHTVIRQNHIGDWGTPFGMLIEHLLDLGEAEAANELSLGDLDKFYKQARVKFDSDPEFATRSRERVVKLQTEHDPETLKLWEFLIKESEQYFDLVYRTLNVLLVDSDVYGESKYNDDLPILSEELEKSGIAVIDDGALCVFPPGFEGRDGTPTPVIVRKSDGGFGYAATDLALVRYRERVLKADRSYHVVDSRQKDHFAMVWAVARIAGWINHTKFEHVSYGSVLGSDGKPYKTRSGDAAKLIDLLDEAVMRAAAVIAERNPDLTGEEADATARMIGIGAVKYSDLANDRIKDYTFDFDRMLSFEGNTAPYLQYAHARIHSIFRKANLDIAQAGSYNINLIEEPERQLALKLLGYSPVVLEVSEYLQPHRLCTYLFELASAFSEFYEKCSVLNAESEEIKQSRLALCAATARTLNAGLKLLGIDSPERM